MLNDEAIHVRDVERAVRPGLEHGGTEPIVRRTKKLGLLLARGAMTLESRAVRLQHFAMNQIVNRFTDENGGRKIRTEEFVAVGHRTVSGSDVVGLSGIVEALQGA